MSRIVLGIDPSAKKIAVMGRHSVTRTLVCRSFVLYKGNEKQTVESMGRAVDAMHELLAQVDVMAPHGERLAWVESPVIGRGGVVTTMKQAYVGGIIRAALHNAGFQVYDANVSTWKKVVVGNGRADKKAVRRAVAVQWPKADALIGSDGDLADAAAIALYGEHCRDTASRLGNAEVGRGRVRRPRS